MRLSFRSQRGRDYVGTHAVDFQYFPAAGAPGNDTHAALRDAEMLRNEIYQGAIGGILDRRRRNADLDLTVVHAGKLRFGGARLDVDVKANGRHMNANLPEGAQDMYSTTVAIDLAKNVFERAVAGAHWRIGERHRLSRAKFAQFFVNRPPCNVVMEACGSAHYWARRIVAAGHDVRLLPAQYVKAYVKRNKTDRADAAALIEAARCADINAVPVKTVEQQQIQALHRLRAQWVGNRVRYINTLRGVLCRSLWIRSS
jgi:hypothetical protein